MEQRFPKRLARALFHRSFAVQPGAGERILARFHPRNYSDRHFGDMLTAAAIGEHTPKDLRDTFASWLPTCGFPLGYISPQLGHSGVSVTARHYSRWAGGDAYRKPLELADGEVPADLLARLDEESDRHAVEAKYGSPVSDRALRARTTEGADSTAWCDQLPRR